MSYAQAAGSGAKSYGAFYNEKLLVCHAGDHPYEKVAEALHNCGYWDHVKVFQKVDLNRRYAVEFHKNDISERLLTTGLSVNGVHVGFQRHQRRVFSKPVERVYISLLPSGVTDEEIIAVLQSYGKVKGVVPINSTLFERRYDTGDKYVYFDGPHKVIPSYINIRGWRVFVRHDNQPPTCRLCDKTGHFARQCPINPRNKPSKEHPGDQPAAEDMEVHVPEPDPTPEQVNSTPTIQEEEPGFYGNASLQKKEGDLNSLQSPPENPGKPDATYEILKNLERFANGSLANIMVEDCQVPSSLEENTEQEKRSKDWADSAEETGESSAAGSEKPQEPCQHKPEETPQVKFKPYCPRCRLDSHSEAQCWQSICKTANKRKHPVGVSKPGKGAPKSKRGRTITRFKQDLEKVVCKGRITDELRYVMEYENRNELYACFLLSNYGDFAEFHSVEGLAMASNPEVMDLWARYSGEGKSQDAADIQLGWFNDQI